MPFAPVTGTRLYYEEAGPAEGRPVLLLHAALQTSESMRPLVRLFQPLGFRCLIPDQRGHGESANPVSGLSIKRLADDMEEFLAYRGVARPLMAGYSLGGIVGLELARRGKLSGLILLASRFRPTERARETFAADSLRARMPMWVKQLEQKHNALPWFELAPQIGEAIATWSGMSAEDLTSITCPVLIVQGTKDEMVSIEQARELAAGIPGARLHEVPHAKHPELLYRADAMESVKTWVEEFLAQP
ncbi:MAG TPA: alpha/beta hydrolase [Symbiobacteriaceae bacterium]|nr:alpha/beta hydrolase [Symbiobacteriaceae bacterium]